MMSLKSPRRALSGDDGLQLDLQLTEPRQHSFHEAFGAQSFRGSPISSSALQKPFPSCFDTLSCTLCL
jgi:hypothetical protein